MEDIERETGRELRRRQRALATGALVRPPKNEQELRLEEQANQAEIDMLTERRERLWSELAQAAWESDRRRIKFDIESATRGLEIAFAARRRLRVARDLFEHPRIRHAAA